MMAIPDHAARLIVINAIWIAALVAATILGYTEFVFAGDKSRVSFAIVAVLIASLVAVFAGRRAHINQAAWLCETLGFVGTLIGITIGLSNVDVAALSSPEGVIAAGNSLFGGVATAFCSTIVGAVAMLWLWSVGRVVANGEAVDG
jgi:hypothetical protein